MSSFDENIKSLYTEYRPAYNNLFEVTLYNAGDNSDLDTEVNKYIKLHAIKVSFGDETLDLQRDNVTKNFRIKDNYAYKRCDLLKITFRESDSFAVKKYHENWMNSIYYRHSDLFKKRSNDYNSKNSSLTAPAKGVYRNIDVTMGPHDNRKCIRFKNVILKNVPGMDLQWGPSGQIIQSTVQYYVESWSWVTPPKEEE